MSRVDDCLVGNFSNRTEQVHHEFWRAGHGMRCVDANYSVDDACAEVDAYRATLASATTEKPMQEFLSVHPRMLLGEIAFGCRWVISQKNLANNGVPDFLTARVNSLGIPWTIVELKTPSVENLFTTKNVPGRHLAAAIQQIKDYRRWLYQNHDMATRYPSQGGLGLIGISDKADGVVYIGREDQRTPLDSERLAQINWDERIEVRSYDSLIREAQWRIDAYRKHGADSNSECPYSSELG
ncbi:Shedu anti-phage system protein SduA domain-containing protein [Lentzea kentuckyensis]|uniref:Shedu anti-phage system protein SduA domain-containing protein n=1 Tax=Lentzea kentuckyensis TaxID=360086 RepID=UPI000A3A8E37|nr:Shedu anti-phage system protein SduA domain-containing protein [Lentzea kentuckyensis]